MDSRPSTTNENLSSGLADSALNASLLESIRCVGIALVDDQTIIRRWTPGMRELTGYRSDEAVGERFSKLLAAGPDDFHLTQQDLTTAAQFGNYRTSSWLRRKDEGRFWSDIAIRPFRDANGALKGFSVVLRDITEELSALRQLQESEQRNRLLVYAVEDYAIFGLDAHGNITSWNRGAERLKGYTPSEILGKSFTIFYPPADVRGGKPAWELETARRRGRVEDEGWRIRKDGTRFWANVVITALRDSAGELIGFAKVTRDLTERRGAEAALRQSEERLRNMVDAVKDYAIFMLDKDGRVATWNSGAERMKGHIGGEIIGAHFSKFYSEEDIAAGKPAWELETALRTGRFEDEGWRLKKDGTRFWAAVVISVLRDKEGNHIGYTKVTRDVTERKVAEEALRRAKDDLETKVQERTAALMESNRELEQFAYIASHDLQEPIRKMILYSEMLHSMMDDEKTKGIADRIIASGRSLKTMVQDLLQLSVLSRPDPNFEWCDLSDILREAVNDLEVAVQESKAVIKAGALPGIEGNRSQLRHLFQNLISNSIKFAKKNVSPVIAVHAENVGSRAVRVSVSDNGIGFDSKYAQKIFGPFQRLHSRSAYAGTGIGLSIVAKIVALHRGKIKAIGDPGNGATFIIDLPLHQRPVE